MAQQMDSLQIKFSVLGGASVDGESGREILAELQSICSSISSRNLLKVKVALDNQTRNGGLLNEIETAVNSQSIKLKFGIDEKYLNDELKKYFKNFKPIDDKKQKNPASSKSLLANAKREYDALKKYQHEVRTSDGTAKTNNLIRAQIALHKKRLESYEQEIKLINDVNQRREMENDLAVHKGEVDLDYQKKYQKYLDENSSKLLAQAKVEQALVAEKEYSFIKSDNSGVDQKIQDEIELHRKAYGAIQQKIQAIDDQTIKQRILNELAENQVRLDSEFNTKDASNLVDSRRKEYPSWIKQALEARRAMEVLGPKLQSALGTLPNVSLLDPNTAALQKEYDSQLAIYQSVKDKIDAIEDATERQNIYNALLEEEKILLQEIESKKAADEAAANAVPSQEKELAKLSETALRNYREMQEIGVKMAKYSNAENDETGVQESIVTKIREQYELRQKDYQAAIDAIMAAENREEAEKAILELREKQAKIMSDNSVKTSEANNARANTLVTKALAEYRKITKLEHDINDGGKSPENVNDLKAKLSVVQETYDTYVAELRTITEIGDGLEANVRLAKEINSINLDAKSKRTVSDYKDNPYLNVVGGDLTRALQLGEKSIKESILALGGLRDELYVDDLKSQIDEIQKKIVILVDSSQNIDLFSADDQLEAQVLLNQLDQLQSKIKSLSRQANTQDLGYEKLYRKISDYYSKYGDAIKNNDKVLYDQLVGMMDAARNHNYEKGFAALNEGFAHLQGQISRTKANTETLWQSIKRIFTEKFGYGVLASAALVARQTLKKMLDTVIEIDTAMTELRKVTEETEGTYDRFLTKAADRAKELGATISDVVTASADFARLGYNIDDAATLADVAIVYKNVGDGITDISAASESIISTMQAFGINAEDAMSIVDRFNEVGRYCPAA